MADLKKLALGRKAFAKPAASKNKAKEKPAKKLEESCAEEVGEAEQAFRDRLTKEDKRRKAATDSEFWFAVYFPDRQAKEAFLRKYGLARIGEKYLPGSAVDRALSRLSGTKDSHKRRG